jgi:hypothetical protein
MSKAAEVVNASKGALGQGDFGGARKLLADHLAFHGPFGASEGCSEEQTSQLLGRPP